MNILYVLNSGKFGGMEHHTLNLAKGMISYGHTVYVWCNEGPIVEHFKNSGSIVDIHEIRGEIDRKYISDLEKYMKDKKIDVVHGHELKACVHALIAGKNAGVPVRISHTHTPISEWRIPAWKKYLDIQLYKKIVNGYASKEIALTESRKKVKMKEGIHEDKLEVIPNGTDISRFNISYIVKTEYREEIMQRYGLPKAAFIFGNVSRLTDEKGQHILINAFHHFMNSEIFHKDDFYLILAGGGSNQETLEKQIKELGLEKNVIITGVFPEEDLVKYYSTFDAFIFPSLAEGFGLVLIEAMYMKLPCICSDLDVLMEVAGDTVHYFQTGNYKDLSEKISMVHEEVADSDAEIVENARKRVEKYYTLDTFYQSYNDLYNRLLGK